MENELTNKSADNGDVQIENAGKPAENVKEKYLFIKNRKKNSKTPIILGAVLFFVIAAAGAYFLNINRLPKKSPQEIIKSSMETMSNLKTYQVDGKINFNGSVADNESKNQSVKINISLNGKNDAANPNNPKAYYSMKTGVNLENEWGNEEYSADFEEIIFGQESVYFRINDYNLGMEMGTILGPQIEPYKGKWYFVSAEEAQKFFENFGNMTPIDMGTFDESKIMDIISKYEVLKFDKDMGDEKLNGIKVYHYKAKLDGMAVVYMYLDVLKEVLSNYDEGAINSEELQENLVKTKKDIEENYRGLINEGFQKAEIEMWIGKEDGYIYRLAAKGGMDEKYINKLSKIIAGNSSDPSDIQDVKVNLDFNIDLLFSNFNKPMGIEKPEDAEDLLGVLEPLISGFLGMPTTITQDSDEDGLSDDLEVLYKTDKNNPDTDGDGYKDGDEVENGYDPALPGDAKLEW